MAQPSGLSRHNNLSELNRPLNTNSGWKSAAERKAATLAALGLTATAAELNQVADASAANRAITATSDGLTTGLILSTDQFVTVTSASANNIVMLPASPQIGQTVKGWIGANGCEVRCDGTSCTINNLNCKTTNEAALAATGTFEATCVGAETWLLRYWTEAGVVTTITPDAV